MNQSTNISIESHYAEIDYNNQQTRYIHSRNKFSGSYSDKQICTFDDQLVQIEEIQIYNTYEQP